MQTKIYYKDEKIQVRNMQQRDARIITDGELAQGWDADITKYEMRLRDQNEGRAVSIVAEYMGDVAGYVNVYPDSRWGAFAGRGYPEIVDFGVLEKYRRNGIGSRLMDVAEQVAAGYSDHVYLGVGLHNGYGSAQRMYVKRGYIPDGTGVWYGDQVCGQYEDCRNDDHLILYLLKDLRESFFRKEKSVDGKKGLQLEKIEGGFSICRLGNLPQSERQQQFFFAAKTDEEVSLVCPTKEVPEKTLSREDGWRAFRIQGVLDFSLTGVLAGISDVLAEGGIGIFAVSTYNTDYILTKAKDYERALTLLICAGYPVG